jgi:hypothetical protein
MSGEGLPEGLGQLFSDGGAGLVLDVDLPPGRLMASRRAGPGGAPAYWLSDGAVSPDLWVQLHQAHPRSGLWPVIAGGLRLEPEQPWVAGNVVSPPPLASIDALDAGAVLERSWHRQIDLRDAYAEAYQDDSFSVFEPFGGSWPGLASAADSREDPDEFADRHVLGNDDGTSRVVLIPAARSADVITAVGWKGSCNYSDTPPLSSVLRSWEDRFGARVIEIGYDTLLLSVAAAPDTAGRAEAVAAEHFAFCPDRILQEFTGTLGQYADSEIRGKSDWWFWWD